MAVSFGSGLTIYELFLIILIVITKMMKNAQGPFLNN